MRHPRPIILSLIFLCALLGALFGGVWLYHARAVPSAPTADYFFATSLPDLAGKEHALEQWRGKILIVNFWAPWCVACIREMPDLMRMQAGLQQHAMQNQLQNNVQVLGIGLDTPAAIRSFVAQHAVNYPIYVADQQGLQLAAHLLGASNVAGLPVTILIDQRGAVKKRYLGMINPTQVLQDAHALFLPNANN